MAPNKESPKHEEGTFSVEGRVPPPLLIVRIQIPTLSATMPGWTEAKVPDANLNKLLTEG